MQNEKLKQAFKFGVIGNILFIVFGLICIVYYHTYVDYSVHSKIIELIAYLTEFSGFGMLIYADYLMIVTICFKKAMKVSFTVYIIIEALMMVLELNAPHLSFYKPFSLPVAIIHAIISGGACFAFLQLDPENKKFEYLVIAGVGIVLTGMMGNLMGVRVYFSIALNALGQALLFGGIVSLIDRQQIEIECYTDTATVAEFNSSTLFSDPEIQKVSGNADEKTENDNAK